MSYNDGKVHTEFYDKKVNIEKIADDFSEGDSKLKSILLALWKNNIKTNACCKGHNDGRPAYISFIINENVKKIIQATSEYLYLQDSKIKLTFVCSSSKEYDTFTVYMNDEKGKENYLNLINNLLSQRNENKEINNNIPEYGYHLLKFARTVGLNCMFIVKKDKMMFGYNRPETLQIFDENSPLLEDIIQSIKETGNIPLVPINCSEKSLQEFINIIYPNTFMVKGTIQK